MTKYSDNFTNHLNDIISLIKDEKIEGENGAIEKFKLYLEEIIEIGPFDKANWRQDWRKKVWKFGELFKNENPYQFIRLIDNKLLIEKVEVIEFLRSEIIVNFLPDFECKKQLEILIESYPLNPEFRNTLGHYYSREKETLKAIEQYKIAHRLDLSNEEFQNSVFGADQLYLDELLEKSLYDDGHDYIDKLLDDKDYIAFGNNVRKTLLDYKKRFTDYLTFEKKLKTIESDFKNKINTQLENERKRIVEILGFFSAIVAFILSTISIAKDFSFVEAVFFIIILAFMLIIFNITLSLLFTNSKISLLKDFRFWLLIISLISIIFFILCSYSISELLN